MDFIHKELLRVQAELRELQEFPRLAWLVTACGTLIKDDLGNPTRGFVSAALMRATYENSKVVTFFDLIDGVCPECGSDNNLWSHLCSHDPDRDAGLTAVPAKLDPVGDCLGCKQASMYGIWRGGTVTVGTCLSCNMLILPLSLWSIYSDGATALQPACGSLKKQAKTLQGLLKK
jgi:hypothetical protein